MRFQTASELAMHVFDVDMQGKTCHYLYALPKNGGHVHSSILRKERYKRGFMAYPESTFASTQGYTSVYPNVCIVCGKPNGQGHRPRYNAMARVLMWTLDTTCMNE